MITMAANNNTDERVFAFDGQLYPSYQEMVDAKRRRNADVLAKSGLLEAAIAAASAAANNRRPTSSDRGSKRAAAARRYRPNGERRKSSRLAGDSAPGIYVDSESGGTFAIAGEGAESVDGGSRGGSRYNEKEGETTEYYNGRINDGSDLTIANAVELTGPKWIDDRAYGRFRV